MSWKDRIYQYEQTPPPAAWEKIAEELDASHLDASFPAKIYEAEAIPPENAWHHIAASLENEDPKVIPFRRYSPILRYAAAAVIIGIIALGIWKWNDNQTGNVTAKVDPSVPVNTGKANGSSAPTPQTEKDEPAVASTSPANTSIAESTDAERPVSKARLRRAVAVSNEDLDDRSAIYAVNDAGSVSSDRYVMLMTPNGYVRMSKKLGDIVCCVAGEEQDADCKDQLRKWQEKLAESPVVPAPGNFMDILSILGSLNETDM